MSKENVEIRWEAEKKANPMNDFRLPHQPDWRNGYIAGVTEERARTLPLVEAVKDYIDEQTKGGAQVLLKYNTMWDRLSTYQSKIKEG